MQRKSHTKQQQKNLEKNYSSAQTGLDRQNNGTKLEPGFGTMRDPGLDTGRAAVGWRAQLLVAFRRGAGTGALWKGRFTCAGLLSCHIVIPDVTEPLAAGSLLLSALLALPTGLRHVCQKQPVKSKVFSVPYFLLFKDK